MAFRWRRAPARRFRGNSPTKNTHSPRRAGPRPQFAGGTALARQTTWPSAMSPVTTATSGKKPCTAAARPFVRSETTR